jgi:hypothetical protein
MSNDLLTHPFMSSNNQISLAGRDFADVVLNVGGSSEGDGSGTNNDEAP